MKKNIGSTDKILRIIAGLIIIVSGLIFKSWWGVIGLALILTAVINWCPAYVPLGISTCKLPAKEKSLK